MAFTIELDGLKALVTGGGQGVGLGIATYLAQAGAHVYVNDVVAERAQEACDKITASGGSASPLPFDVTDLPAVTAAVESTGGIDILVNNAGNAGTGRIGTTMFNDTDPSEWDKYFSVNLFGPMNASKAVIPAMIDKKWGRIITVVSDAGRIGEPALAAYSAAKGGATAFSRSLAKELGRHAITVNNIALGSMNTPSSSGRSSDDPALKRYIIRRFGEPEDVAGMALYLASPLSSWVTGQTFAVNGGYSVTL